MDLSIEKYAELCALMAETGGDIAKENAIASEQGVDAESWSKAKTNWTKKMSDPADQGKTALSFMAALQDAQSRLREGNAPGSIEDYAKIHAEMAFLKDGDGNAMDPKKIVHEHGYTWARWLEMENYWTPRTQADDRPEFKRHYDPAAAMKFKELLQKESDLINGVTR